MIAATSNYFLAWSILDLESYKLSPYRQDYTDTLS